jgi:hypothetical protein
MPRGHINSCIDVVKYLYILVLELHSCWQSLQNIVWYNLKCKLCNAQVATDPRMLSLALASIMYLVHNQSICDLFSSL